MKNAQTFRDSLLAISKKRKEGIMSVGEPAKVMEVVDTQQPEISDSVVSTFLEKRNERIKKANEFTQKVQSRKTFETNIPENIKAGMLELNISREEAQSGDVRFKTLVQSELERPEAPTVIGGLTEVGKKLIGKLTGAFGEDSFFAGGKIGDAIGATLAQKPESAPKISEVIADAGLIGLDILTLGKGKVIVESTKQLGKEAIKQGGKEGFKKFVEKTIQNLGKSEFAKAGAIGAGYGGFGAVKEGAEPVSKETAMNTAMGAGLGLAVVGIPLLATQGAKFLISKLPSEIKKQAQEEVQKLTTVITQGRKVDAQKQAKALEEINSEGIKTYDDLSKKINDKIKALAETQDEILAKDTAPYLLDDLGKTIKVGEREVSQNFVKESLDDLEKLYTDTNELELLAKIQNIRDKAQKEGLTALEINQLAREYGSEFSKKAFDKIGNPRTSVSAGRFENNRVGVKEQARIIIKDPVAKELDTRMSNLFSAKENVEKMVEKVSDLMKRAENRTLLQKAGEGLADLVDLAMGRAVSAFARRILIPRGGGIKMYNALDIEEELAENLARFAELSKKANMEAQSDEISTFLSKIKGKKIQTPDKSTNTKTKIQGLQSSTANIPVFEKNKKRVLQKIKK